MWLFWLQLWLCLGLSCAFNRIPTSPKARGRTIVLSSGRDEHFKTLAGITGAAAGAFFAPRNTYAIGKLPELESSTKFAQHLVLNVPDMEEALMFYCKGLGMKVLRSRIVGQGTNSTFVGYGPETLTIPPDFIPGVSSFAGYGGHFSLELNQAPRESPDAIPFYDPGDGIAYLQIAVPTLRVSSLLAAGGIIKYSYGWFIIESPGGLTHQVIVGARRDPMMFLAMKVQDIKKSVAFYENVLGMTRQEYPLSRVPGSQFEPKQPMNTVYLSYDPDGFGILLLRSENKKKVNVGGIVDKLAILDTNVLEKGKEFGDAAKFVGRAPGIGTRVAVAQDPDGYGIVLVEYDDFEKELK